MLAEVMLGVALAVLTALVNTVLAASEVEPRAVMVPVVALVNAPMVLSHPLHVLSHLSPTTSHKPCVKIR